MASNAKKLNWATCSMTLHVPNVDLVSNHTNPMTSNATKLACATYATTSNVLK